MEEERKATEKEAQKLMEQKTIKVSELLKNQQQSSGVSEIVAQQVQNNQELYTTLSRSLLELHNDMRGFRNKGENLDRVVFSMQQSINQNFAALDTKVKQLEENLNGLTELCNSALETLGVKDAFNKERKED